MEDNAANSIAGKILLINTFGLSQFVYLSSVITIPNEVILEIEKILYIMISYGKVMEGVLRGTQLLEIMTKVCLRHIW